MLPSVRRALFERSRTLAAGIAVAVAMAAAAAPAQAAPPDADKAGAPIAVDVVGASEPVLCAEKDNVTINLTSADVRRFRIEAAHPAYIGSLVADSFAADWTACDMRGDPAHAGAVKAPTRRTIYEEPEIWLVGWTFPTFWRPATATVRIGERIERGLHLVQLWMIRPMGGEEVLVFYPQDGYWRARPLAPSGKAPTAFGSSFLVGPVEVDGRPVVRLTEIAFDPAKRTFTLSFARGGSATIRLAGVDQSRTILDVAFDRAIDGVPFAALRSMYVTETNNDVARIGIRAKDAKGWAEEPIMSFRRSTATSVWTGRVAPSRHNTSSPDIIFDDFRGATR